MASVSLSSFWAQDLAPSLSAVPPLRVARRMPEAVSEPARAEDADAAEVAAARGGDADAFRALVERHRARAHALAWRMLRSPADAEEVTQDAFVRAWRALPGFRGEARFSTWLHRIVARLALDRLEVLARRRQREIALDGLPEPAVATPDAGGDARIEAAIATLSPAQQAVVRLYYLEDRSVEAVARHLGFPENTVKTHLSRARTALRAAWLAGEAR